MLEAGPESPDRPYCLGEALPSLPLLAFSSQHLRLQFILSDHQAMHTDTGQPAVSINLTHVSSMSLSLSFFLSFFLLSTLLTLLVQYCSSVFSFFRLCLGFHQLGYESQVLALS